MTTARKRILYVTHSDGPSGGSFKSLMYMLKALDREAFEPVVACVSPSLSLVQHFRESGFEAFHWPGIDRFPHTTGGSLSLFSPIGAAGTARVIAGFRSSVDASRKLVERVRPAIVHINSLVLPSVAVGAAKSGVPIVWHIRESVVDGTLGLRKRWLARMVRRYATQAIFISTDDRRRLLGSELDQPGVVIPNFVDFRVFDKHLDQGQARLKFGIPDKAKVVLFVGGIGRLKGGSVLLRAFSRIVRRVPNAHLVVAGGIAAKSNALRARVARAVLPLVGLHTERQEFEAALNDSGIAQRVTLLPFIQEAQDLYAASDVVAFPSIAPHFARPVIEAGAMSKPVVASRLGGVEELVVDGESAWLVAPRNVVELADAIAKLFENPDQARTMGESGWRRAQKFFDVSTNMAAICGVYNSVVGRGNSGRKVSRDSSC